MAWFTSIFDAGGSDRPDFFECQHCKRSYDEWTGDCPECGQLVVRIVEPPDGQAGR